MKLAARPPGPTRRLSADLNLVLFGPGPGRGAKLRLRESRRMRGRGARRDHDRPPEVASQGHICWDHCVSVAREARSAAQRFSRLHPGPGPYSHPSHARPARRPVHPSRGLQTKSLLHLFVVNSRHMLSFCGSIMCLSTLLMISAIPSEWRLAYSIQRLPAKFTFSGSSTQESNLRAIFPSRGNLLDSSPFSHRHFLGTSRFELGKRSRCYSRLLMSEQPEARPGLSAASIEDIPTGPDAFYSPMEVIVADLVVELSYTDQ